MKNKFLLVPCLCLAAYGCRHDASSNSASSNVALENKTPTSASKSTDPAPTVSAPNLSDTASTVSPGTGKPSDPNKTIPSTSAQSLKAKPASPAKVSAQVGLEHEGFLYSGVGNPKPVDMELTMSTQPNTVTTGSQTVTLKEDKDGRRVYGIDRTGGLAALGTEEWTVTKEGVFTTKSSLMDVGDKAMELPATPKPGMTWNAHAKSSQPGSAMDMDMTFKVIGTQDVSTKGGKFKGALLVEQDSTGTLQGKKVRTESQNWYVKGLGLVKATMKNHLPDGKTETLLIQETKSK